MMAVLSQKRKEKEHNLETMSKMEGAGHTD